MISSSSSSSSSSNGNNNNQSLLGVVLFLGGALGYWYHQSEVARISKQAEDRRREERTGRIRAEVKLRTLSKEKEALEWQLTTTDSATASTNGGTTKSSVNHPMVLRCVGTVVSPYTKRMGTPRQGSLVPSSRAFIQIDGSTLQMEALDGMEDYSHLWILFGFHANTTSATTSNTKKAKVRPPRAPHKVGQLATRSPHRPNPIGLSLVKMERLDTKLKRVHISALDLVHGTPVYDIKPVVPWDIPGHHHDNNHNSSSNNALQVPDWVSQKDEIHTVQFTPQAETAWQTLLQQGRMAPLYTPQNDSDAEASRATLVEILAQDPRSSHKGLKVNQRGTTNKSSQTYSLIFCQTQVNFVVLSWGVQVESVTAVDFDDDAYVEGIPLIFEQKQQPVQAD
ncbi:Putative S-adenosylmethionine-dependent methyltransferase RcsF [Seminavis robusta]|uniref:S-adenosylmethionine-dependent methyltransferase RcsF n=1 Tax=Seminavis robusta TaxID=568900 RepID=A0A9N8DRQ9_9STRA|nr:Putative S-adenosylmethionine-dependent methyltransferase RcsF [Seminavis robusta]|eukprot:Sro206_g086580.1 Putative S-adenosylmethionine-dependent methyltransferase RcsF (395) ;mRNA; r:51327-52511